MKNTIITSLLLISLFSCKKQETPEMQIGSQETNSLQEQDKYLSNVKAYLKDTLSAEDYRNLDFKNAVATKFGSGKIFLLRIQFKKPSTEFILLKTDTLGNCSKGMILKIQYSKELRQSDVSKTPHSFNGNIIKTSLDRTSSNSLKITNGYKELKNEHISIVPSNTLLDVVVIAYIYPDRVMSFSDWYNLLNFFTPMELGLYGYGGGDEGYNTYSYYSPIDPTTYSQTGGYIPVEDPKEIAYEDVESLQGISISSYLKCFENIPDAGASCSIEIFTDLPVNGEPNTFFNWEEGSPGHTFLQIKKSNGSQSVQQSIGFYPDQGWKTIFNTDPITGKFADNQSHEYNGSMKMSLTPEQLHTVINEMLYLSGFVKYDIDEYNCTDFALQVFNSVRIVDDEIKIPKFMIPGGLTPSGTNTPQGLYQRLQAIKEEGGPEASNITFPGVAGYVGGSKGPCY